MTIAGYWVDIPACRRPANRAEWEMLRMTRAIEMHIPVEDVTEYHFPEFIPGKMLLPVACTPKKKGAQ